MQSLEGSAYDNWKYFQSTSRAHVKALDNLRVGGLTGQGGQAAKYWPEGLRIGHHYSAQKPKDKGRFGLLALVAHNQIDDLLQIGRMHLQQGFHEAGSTD